MGKPDKIISYPLWLYVKAVLKDCRELVTPAITDMDQARQDDINRAINELEDCKNAQ